MQPPDVSFMKPLSTYYDHELEKWLRNNPGRVVTTFQVAELFGNAYMKAATAEIAANGFRKTEIYSTNRDIFLPHEFEAADPTDIAIDEAGNEGGGAAEVSEVGAAEVAVHGEGTVAVYGAVNVTDGQNEGSDVVDVADMTAGNQQAGPEDDRAVQETNEVGAKDDMAIDGAQKTGTVSKQDKTAFNVLTDPVPSTSRYI